jgi:CRISPR type I-E-associated protein CasB/Cse2
VSNPHSDSAEPTRNQVIGLIAHRLSDRDRFGTGPLAELRRLDPDGPLSEPALHRLLTNVPESWLVGDGLRRWTLIVHAMALAAPDGLKATARLGSALLASGFKEGRLVNLLDATSDELLTALPRAVRFLVTRGHSLNAFALADLVLSASRDDGGWSESVRRRIAQDYYRAEARAATGSSEAAEAP